MVGTAAAVSRLRGPLLTLARQWPAVLLLLATAALGSMLVVKSIPPRVDAAYVGSASCASCHRDEHVAWKDSLHARMMRRVDQPGVVVASMDTASGDPPPFDTSQAVWAIGSKWEQQFMGQDGQHETLLPGAWQVGKGQWQATGWDGWRVPEPLRRCHGCHTVGLDVETGTFVEPSIGCESCHGPGEWHVDTAGIGRLHSALDADTCGQCHSRGKSTDGEYFFPVGFRPGDDLASWFNPMRPSAEQNTNHWWGNGRARKRHQSHAEWSRGGHANSLASLREGYDGRFGAVDAGCLECHSGEAAVAGSTRGLKVDEVQAPVTCAVCHQVHGTLDQARATCGTCHQDGPLHHLDANRPRHPTHPGEQPDCVSCHMPRTGLNGGEYVIHSHAPGFVSPRDTTQFGVPNGCANSGCHDGASEQWLQDALAEMRGSTRQGN